MAGKASGAAKPARIERILRILQRRGMRRGVMGGSSSWFWVFVGSIALRRIRRAIGSEPELVYRGELRPGQTFRIDHLAETYGGGKVKVRRRHRR